VWLYEVGMDYINMGTITFSMEELRYLSGVKETQYVRTNNFIAKVLDTAIKEVNSKTNIKIEMLKIKTGRTITDIRFIIEKKEEENTSPLFLQEFIFRTFWTTILNDIEFNTKFDGGKRIKPIIKNGVVMIINCETQKPFGKEVATKIYDYFFNRRIKFYENIKNHNVNFELEEDMNTELNNFFLSFTDHLTKKQKTQFDKYTSNMTPTEIENIFN